MEIEHRVDLDETQLIYGKGVLSKIFWWFQKTKIRPRVKRDINLEQSIENGKIK